jgi:hypothetical protein
MIFSFVNIHGNMPSSAALLMVWRYSDTSSSINAIICCFIDECSCDSTLLMVDPESTSQSKASCDAKWSALIVFSL